MGRRPPLPRPRPARLRPPQRPPRPRSRDHRGGARPRHPGARRLTNNEDHASTLKHHASGLDPQAARAVQESHRVPLTIRARNGVNPARRDTVSTTQDLPQPGTVRDAATGDAWGDAALAQQPAVPVEVVAAVGEHPRGVRCGRPLSPRIGGIASSRGSSWGDVVAVPRTRLTASGMPSARTSLTMRWCFEPGWPRLTGKGPTWSRFERVHAGGVDRAAVQVEQPCGAELGQQQFVQGRPHAGLGPVPHPPPAGHPEPQADGGRHSAFGEDDQVGSLEVLGLPGHDVGRVGAADAQGRRMSSECTITSPRIQPMRVVHSESGDCRWARRGWLIVNRCRSFGYSFSSAASSWLSAAAGRSARSRRRKPDVAIR